MEDLKIKYINFKKSFKALERSIQHLRAMDPQEESYETMMSGVIKKFENLYDTCWKFLQSYLKAFSGKAYNSPREAFKGLLAMNIASEKVVEDLLILIEERNRSAHTYSEEVAQNVCYNILQHYQAFGQLFVTLPQIEQMK